MAPRSKATPCPRLPKAAFPPCPRKSVSCTNAKDWRCRCHCCPCPWARLQSCSALGFWSFRPEPFIPRKLSLLANPSATAQGRGMLPVTATTRRCPAANRPQLTPHLRFPHGLCLPLPPRVTSTRTPAQPDCQARPRFCPIPVHPPQARLLRRPFRRQLCHPALQRPVLHPRRAK